MDPKGIDTMAASSARRRGRPTKALGVMRSQLLERLKRESLRGIAKSLGISHSTLRERIAKADIVPGADYGRVLGHGLKKRVYKGTANGN
jgi:hypothetical protein